MEGTVAELVAPRLLGESSDQTRRAERREHHHCGGEIRNAPHADASVAPGLTPEPGKSVPTIGAIVLQHSEAAFGVVATTSVLDSHRKAAADGKPRKLQRPRRLGEFAIWRAHH